MADNSNILNIGLGQTADIEKFMKQLADGLDLIQKKVESVSISDITNASQIQKATQALAGYQKQLNGIQADYKNGLLAATKDAAGGMADALATPLRRQMSTELSGMIAGIQSDLNGIEGLNIVGDSLDDLQTMSDQLSQIQATNAQTLDISQQLANSYSSSVDFLSQGYNLLSQIENSASDTISSWKQVEVTSDNISQNLTAMATASDAYTESLDTNNDLLASLNAESDAMLETSQQINETLDNVGDDSLKSLYDEMSRVNGLLEEFAATPPVDPELLDQSVNSMGDLNDEFSELTDSTGDLSDSLSESAIASQDINDIMKEIQDQMDPDVDLFSDSVEQMQEVSDLANTSSDAFSDLTQQIEQSSVNLTDMLKQTSEIDPLLDEKVLDKASDTFETIQDSAEAIEDSSNALTMSASDFSDLEQSFQGFQDGVAETSDSFEKIVQNASELTDASESLKDVNEAAGDATLETLDALDDLKKPSKDNIENLVGSSESIAVNLGAAADSAEVIDRVLGYSGTEVDEAAKAAKEIAKQFDEAQSSVEQLGKDFADSVFSPEIQLAPKSMMDSQMSQIAGGMNSDMSAFYDNQSAIANAMDPFEDNGLADFNDDLRDTIDLSGDLGDIMSSGISPNIEALQDTSVNPNLMSDTLVSNLKDGSMSIDEFVEKLKELEDNKAYETINQIEKEVDKYVDDVATTTIANQLVDLQEPIGVIDDNFENISDYTDDIAGDLRLGRGSLTGMEKSARGMKNAFEQTRAAVSKIFRSDTEKMKAEYEYLQSMLGRAQGSLGAIAGQSGDISKSVTGVADEGKTALEQMTDLLGKNEDRLKTMLSKKFIQDKIDPSLQGINDAIEKGMRGKVVDLFAGEIGEITGMAPEFARAAAESLVPALENVGKGEEGKLIINQLLNADNLDKKSLQDIALKMFESVGPAMALGSAKAKNQIQDIVEQNMSGISGYIDKQMAAGTSLDQLGAKYESELRKNIVDKTSEALSGVLDIDKAMAAQVAEEFIPTAEEFDKLIVEQGGDIDKVLAKLKDAGQLSGQVIQSMLKAKSGSGPTEVVDVDHMKDAQKAMKEMRREQQLETLARTEKALVINKEVSELEKEISTIDDYIKTQEQLLKISNSDEESVAIRQTIRGLKEEKATREELLDTRKEEQRETKYEIVQLGGIYKSFRDARKSAQEFYGDVRTLATKGYGALKEERELRHGLNEEQKNLIKTYKEGDTVALKQVVNSQAMTKEINETILALQKQNEVERQRIQSGDTSSEDRLKAQQVIAANERQIAREQDKLMQTSLEKTRARVMTFLGSGGLKIYDGLRKTVKALKGEEDDSFKLVQYTNDSLQDQQKYLQARSKQLKIELKDMRERIDILKEEKAAAIQSGASQAEVDNIDTNIKYYEEKMNKANAEISSNQSSRLAVFAGRAARFATAPITAILAGAGGALGIVQKETEKVATATQGVADAEQGVIEGQEQSIQTEQERQGVLNDTIDDLGQMRTLMDDIDDPNWGQNLVRAAADASKFVNKLQNGYAEKMGGMFQSLGDLGKGISSTQKGAANLNAGLGNSNVGDLLQSLGSLDLSSLNNFSQNMGDFQDKLGSAADVMKSFGMSTESISKISGVATKAFAGLQVAMAGVEIGAQIYDTLMGKSAATIAKAVGAYEKFMDQLDQTMSLVTGASKGSVRDAIHEQQLELIKQKKAFDVAKEGSLKYTGSIDTWRTVVEKAVTGQTHIYGPFGEKMQEASDAMKAANQQIENLKKIEVLTEGLAKYKDNIEKINDAYQTALTTQLDIADLIKKRNDDLQRDEADRDRQIRRDNEQKEMDTMFAQEDWASERLSAWTDHLQSISDTEKEMFKESNKMQDDFNKQQKESYEQLMKSLKEGEEENKQATFEAIDEYNEQTYETQVSHLKEMASAEKDYEKDRVRRLEDLYDTLAGLEMDNDALGYLKAQQDANKEFKRSDDDHAESMKQSEDQYNETRAENEKAHQEQMDDLRLQNEQRKLEAVNGYLEQRIEAKKSLDEQLQDLRKSNEERLDEEAKGYAKSEAEAWNRIEIDQEREKLRTDLQKRYAAEDAELQAKLRDAEFKAQLDDLMFQQKTALDLLEQNGFDRGKIIAQANAAILDSETEFGINRLKVEGAYQSAMMQIMTMTSGWVQDEEERVAQQSVDLQADAPPDPEMHARGGDVKIDKPSIVGEEGPEFLIPKNPGTVIPNEETEMILSLMKGDNPIAQALKKLFGGSFATGGKPPLNMLSRVGERGRETFLPDGVSISGTNIGPINSAPTGGAGGIARDNFGRTGVSTRNSNPALQVYSGHVKTPIANTGINGTNQYESQLSGLTKMQQLSKTTSEKLIETQSKLQDKMRELQDSTSKYTVSLAGFDRSALDKKRKEYEQSFTDELTAKRNFAKDQARQNQAFNKDILDDNQENFGELEDIHKKGWKDINAEGAEAFDEKLQQISEQGDQEKTTAEKGYDAMLDARSTFSDDELALIGGFMGDQQDVYKKYYGKTDDDLVKHNEVKTGHIKTQQEKEIDLGNETADTILDATKTSADGQVAAVTEAGDEIVADVQSTMGDVTSSFTGAGTGIQEAFDGITAIAGVSLTTMILTTSSTYSTLLNMLAGHNTDEENSSDTHYQEMLNKTDLFYGIAEDDFQAYLDALTEIYAPYYDNHLLEIEDSLKNESKTYKTGSENVLKLVKTMWSNIESTSRSSSTSAQSLVKSIQSIVESIGKMADTAGAMAQRAAQAAQSAATAAQNASRLGSASSGRSGGWTTGQTLRGGAVTPTASNTPTRSAENQTIRQMGQQMSNRNFFAEGGRTNARKPIVVGEDGPETFIPDGSGYIAPNKSGKHPDLLSSLGQLMKKSGGTQIIPPWMERGMYHDTSSRRYIQGASSSSTMHMRIDNVSVGSDISRREIEGQFAKLGKAIVQTVSDAVG